MGSTTPAAKQGRARRALATLGRGLVLGGVFGAALGGAVVLHLDLAPVRHTARDIVNGVLEGLFEGRLTVGDIGRLGLDGVTFHDVRVVDPEGSQVIDVHALRADAGLIGLARSALFGRDDVEIPISRAHIDVADVSLDRSSYPDGKLRIASAFALRPSAPGGRGVHLTIDHIAIDRARAHGAVAASAALDMDVSSLAAGLTLSPADGLRIAVAPTPIRGAAPVPGRVEGDATFRLHRTGPGEGLAMGATFAGTVGDVGLRAGAGTRGGRLEEGTLSVPHATPTEVAALLPELGQALRAPVSLEMEAEGELPAVRWKGRLGFEGRGAIDAAGTVAALAPLSLDAAVGLHALDPRVVIDVASAPPIDATGHVTIAGDTVDADARAQPFELSGYRIAGADARAHRDEGSWRGAADGQVASLRGPVPLRGSGRVHAEGSWAGGAVDARVTARLDDLRVPGAAGLDHGALAARVEGPLEARALRVQASLQGSGLHAGFSSWPRVSAQAAGPLLAPTLTIALGGEDREPVRVRGALDVEGRQVEGIEARLGDGEVRLRVARVAAAAGGVRIEGLRLDGAGTLAGNLTVAGGEVTGTLHGEDVDLDRVARLAGAPWHVAGRAGVDLDLASRRPGLRTGHVAVALSRGGIAEVTGIEGRLAADFDGDRLRGGGVLRIQGDAACGGVAAEVKATDGDGRLPGALLDADAWRHVSGRIQTATDDADLACLSRLPAFDPHAEVSVRGKLRAKAVVERAPGAPLPGVRDVSVETRGLAVTGPGVRSLHTDVAIEGASLDGAGGAAEARIALRDGGTLASLSLSATLDLPALLGSGEGRWASLRRTPFHGHLSVPRRAITAFAGLPSFVAERVPILSGPGDTLTGDVQLDAEVGGTLDAPAVDARAKGFGLRHATIVEPPPAQPGCTGGPAEPPARLGGWGLSVDVDARATYDGREARLDALDVTHDGRKVASATARVALPVADLIAGRARPRGDASIELDRLPLDEVPLLGDREVGGHLSGTVRVEGLGDRPSARVSLRLPDLAIGSDLSYDRAEISADVTAPEGGRSEARARVTLSGRAAGDLDVRATAKVVWEHGLLPLPDQDLPAELTLAAKRFRVAAVAPLLPRKIASHLDGLLDGMAHLTWSAAEAAVPVTAELSLRGGVVDLPPLGQRLRDVTFDVTGGRGGTLKIAGLSARGGAGRIQGHGSATFERWSLACADLGCLRQARVELSVARTEQIPIALGGTPIGDVSGQVGLVAAARSGGLDLQVSPDLRVALSPALGHGVQSLDDDPDFRVCYAEKPPVTARRISVSIPLRLAVSGKVLDDKVKVVDATLTGMLLVDLGGERARTSGEITVRKGARVELLGKELEIETGKVTLDRDPRRSLADVAGQGEAPEGHLELAYTGPVTPLDLSRLSCLLGDRLESECRAALLSGAQAKIAGNVSATAGTAADGNPQGGLTTDVGTAHVTLSTYYGAGAAGAASSGGATGLQGQRTVITLDNRFFRKFLARFRADLGSDQQTVGADILWQHQF